MGGILAAGEARLHHVGIVCGDPAVFEPLVRLATSNGDGAAERAASRYVPEFACDCYLLGQLELVVPKAGAEGTPLTPLERWLTGRGTSLHHIAFEVDDVESQAASLKEAGVPVVLDRAVDGVAGMRVNFVHPSYCGFLVELVEIP